MHRYNTKSVGSLSVAPPQVVNPMSALAIPGQQSGRDYHQWPLAPILPPLLQGTVSLEYFAGEKPLRRSQISRKFDPLQSNYCVLAGIVCIY